MQLTIPTTDDIRAVVDAALTEFFSSYPIQPKSETDEIGGIELAIEITGKAKPTIYSLCAGNLIPHSKRGKKLYFYRAELLAWLKDGKRKTHSELALDAENFSPNISKQNKSVVAR